MLAVITSASNTLKKLLMDATLLAAVDEVSINAHRKPFILQNTGAVDIEYSSLEKGGADFGKGTVISANGGIMQIDVANLDRCYFRTSSTAGELRIESA